MVAKPSSPRPSALPKYEQPAETKHELDWADLVTLDLSQFDVPGGKQKLAKQLRDAVHQVGFFYVINFGMSQDEVDEQFAIAKALFDLPLDEKSEHLADVENGNNHGYRPAGLRELAPGLRDNIEMYNLFKLNGKQERSHPDLIQQYRRTIEKFQRHCAEHITGRLLALIAIILELPEDELQHGHQWDDPSDCHLRYMLYHARTPEDNARAGNLYGAGHSDFGTLTLLFRQPIAALQIRTDDGNWKWVKPYPASVTVNIADALQFWSSGYLKSSVHRVGVPPDDQAHLDRLGLLYFVRPSPNLDLKALESPLLRRLGWHANQDDASGIKAGDWVKARVKEDTKDGKHDSARDVPVIGGISAKYYQ